MKKFKIFIDFAKEEKWLEEMAAKGYMLRKKTFSYMFGPAPPERPNIKIDYRIFYKRQDFEDYRSLFEDSGWRHIAGTKNSGSQYFIKTSESGKEDIFSDDASRAGRYKRLSDMCLSYFIILVPFLFIIESTGGLDINGLLNPKALYYTPGLWDMKGFEFWRRFLFETPFALMRGYTGVLWVLMFILYGLFTFKSWTLYKKAHKDSTK